MTENEFRDALKRSVGSTELSSGRQYQVLARMKGEEKKVRTWNMKLILVAMVLFMTMGMTCGVASGLIGVDWFGEPTAPHPSRSIGQTETEARLLELLRSVPDEEPHIIRALESRPDERAEIMSGYSNWFANDLGEIQKWVEEDGGLPWVSHIPEGYGMELGRVAYACANNGEFELIENRITEDDYQVVRLRLPEKYRFLHDYTVRLNDATGNIIMISVALQYHTGDWVFNVDEGGSVQQLDVAGMNNSLYIAAPDEVKLAMRSQLGKIIECVMPHLDQEGVVRKAWSTFGCMTIVITATDTSMTADDLLGIFGLETQ